MAVPTVRATRPAPVLDDQVLAAGERTLRARVRWGPVWVLPTRHGWGALLVAALVWAAWRPTRLDLLASLALLLASPVLVGVVVAWCLVLVWALPRPWVHLSLPALPQAGQQVAVRAWAGWRLPRFLPSWILWRAAGVGGGGGDTTLTPLDREGTVLGAQAHRRGPAVVEAARLHLREPLGMVRASVPVGVAAHLLVLPRPLALDRALTLPRALRPGGVRVGAAGEEHLAALRDYRPGDALASIHWKQSARADHLLVTEREPESHLHARVALVVRPGGPPQPEEVETAISLAAGVVTEWSSRQHLGVELSVILGPPASPGDPAPPAVPDPSGWRVLRWDAEAGEGLMLLRVLAVLDLCRPDARTSLLPSGTWQEPDTRTWAPRLLGADVVVAVGGAVGTAGTAVGTAGTLPALDPASRGTLVVVEGSAAGRGGRRGLAEAEDLGRDLGHGAVPPGWQVLAVDAASGEVTS